MIIWTNAELLLIGHLGTNFSEIFIEILIFSLKKMRLKVSSAKRRPFCLGLNELIAPELDTCYIYMVGVSSCNHLPRQEYSNKNIETYSAYNWFHDFQWCIFSQWYTHCLCISYNNITKCIPSCECHALAKVYNKTIKMIDDLFYSAMS